MFFSRHLTAEQREEQLAKILLLETRIILPVKIILVIFLALSAETLSAYYLVLNNVQLNENQGAFMELAQWIRMRLIIYSIANAIFYLVLTRFKVMKDRTVRLCVFLLSHLDHLFLATLIFLTGGLQSSLYWIYCGIIVRNAMNFPQVFQQAFLNLSVCGFYLGALLFSERNITEADSELILLRLIVLLMVAISCWGVSYLLEEQRIKMSTDREYMIRSAQLSATGQLAAEIAHQLKNPLGIINNVAFSLDRQLKYSDENVKKLVQIIRDEVSRSDRILTDLMDYSRLADVKIEKVNINATLEEALDSVLPSGLPSRIKVVKIMESNLPPLMTQKSQLIECFSNLIKNAVEAMGEEGRLTLSTRYLGEGLLQVTISDTGMGIAPEEKEKIFHPFFTTKKKGTGLGLSIAKHIVETNAGKLTVDSRVGKGTTFNIVLPIHLGQQSKL